MAKTDRKNKGAGVFSVLCVIAFYAAVILLIRFFVPDSRLKTETTSWYDKIISSSAQTLYSGTDGLYSNCAIMVDTTTGEIYCEKNSTESVPVASLTKIMTALVAIEKLDSLDAEYMFTADVIRQMDEEHASVAGFAVGETVCARDLLYSVMLPSGGDAAAGLARLVAGEESAFVEMMNERAGELGLSSTHFSNVTGLDDAQNYSSAADIALLFDCALNNGTFREIVMTREYLTAATPQHPNGILLKSTLSNGLETYSLSSVVAGGKTGFTGEAGQCLATFAEYNGEKIIAVTLGAGDQSNSPQYSFADAAALYGEFLN